MQELFESDYDEDDDYNDYDESEDDGRLDYKATPVEKNKLILWKDLPKHSLFILEGENVNIAIKVSGTRFVYLETYPELGEEYERGRYRVVKNPSTLLVQRYWFEYNGA